MNHFGGILQSTKIVQMTRYCHFKSSFIIKCCHTIYTLSVTIREKYSSQRVNIMQEFRWNKLLFYHN